MLSFKRNFGYGIQQPRLLNTSDDPDYEVSPNDGTPPPRGEKEELIDEEVVSIIDKCKISGGCAVLLTVALLKKLKLDPRSYNISRSTIERRRTMFRESAYEKIKDKINLSRGAVVHFDGKLTSPITGKEKVHRLAVKVTYGEVD